jgi:hypothetical protein
LNTEEEFFKAQRQALLFEAWENKTHVLHVFLQGANEDTYVVEVSGNELV